MKKIEWDNQKKIIGECEWVTLYSMLMMLPFTIWGKQSWICASSSSSLSYSFLAFTNALCPCTISEQLHWREGTLPLFPGSDIDPQPVPGQGCTFPSWANCRGSTMDQYVGRMDKGILIKRLGESWKYFFRTGSPFRKLFKAKGYQRCYRTSFDTSSTYSNTIWVWLEW